MRPRPVAPVFILLLMPFLLVAQERSVVLIAGAMVPVDRTGHHDYRGGIGVMQDCLRQTAGIQVVPVLDGWPADEQVLASAQVVVFYCDGGGKQPYLADPRRTAVIDTLVARGGGLVLIHQAVDHPATEVERALRWLGGTYDPAGSTRGHWQCTPDGFPVHELTAGGAAWTSSDGWLSALRFVADRRGLVPCAWASKRGPSTSIAGDAGAGPALARPCTRYQATAIGDEAQGRQPAVAARPG